MNRCCWALFALTGCQTELLDLPIWVDAEVHVGAELCDRGDVFSSPFAQPARVAEIENRHDEPVYVEAVGGIQRKLDEPVLPDLTFVVDDGSGGPMLVDRVTLRPGEAVAVWASAEVSCKLDGTFPEGRFDRQVIVEASTAWRDPADQRVDVHVDVDTVPL
ncbi:MAG: hypothetical protein R3F59_09690 [Myxococcota bacterium]